MKKISLYITLALSSLFMGACSDEYEPWADPQSNSEEVIKLPGYKATPAGPIDLATAEGDSVATYVLNSAALPEGYTLEGHRIEMTPTGVDDATATTITTTEEGFATKADLQTLVESVYGKAPVARTFKGHVYANAVKDGMACLIDAGTVDVVVTTKAPKLSTAYYIVGGEQDWQKSATDRTQKFQHSDKNFYDDPVFTITIKAKENDDTWFAIASEEACEGIANGDWSKLYGTTVGNGNNSLDKEEKYDARTALSDDGSFKVPASAGAKYIKVTINVLDQTYTIKALNFQETLYLAGDCNGWNQIDELKSPEFNGIYTGFMYLNKKGFKFCTQPNWDGTNYGTDFSTGGNATDIMMTEAEGYYKVVVDLTTNKYTLTPITTIGVVGSGVGSWDVDKDMTYNKTDRCWEIKNLTLSDGEIKFRANDLWDINWGGSVNSLTQGGANLKVNAGTYNIKLYAWADGVAKCEITPVKK